MCVIKIFNKWKDKFSRYLSQTILWELWEENFTKERTWQEVRKIHNSRSGILGNVAKVQKKL
jgi:hypothetical protein